MAARDASMVYTSHSLWKTLWGVTSSCTTVACSDVTHKTRGAEIECRRRGMNFPAAEARLVLVQPGHDGPVS